MSTAHNIVTGQRAQTSENARELHDTLVEKWNLPQKRTDDGLLGDISAARELARDPENVEEAYGHRHAFLASALAGNQYERGQDAAVDEVIERSAEPDNARAEIDQTVVQAASPIEVDPEIVCICQTPRPCLTS
jgi:hypothetical protein